ncbi:MAG: hypothetical protein JW793_11190, partial [Acidobacteria bacterium]|nr:hypothetical protein [Acidobacteriota bacterium]
LSMTAIFEWLFKYRPLLYERGTIDFEPLWSAYVTGILLAAAILLPYVLYRRSAGLLPDSWRYGLAALRASAFAVVLLIFLQPVLRIESVVPQQNFVAVAYDFSKSMEIRDEAGGRSRLEAEEQILRPVDNPVIEALESKFKLRYFRFSGSAERSESFPAEMRRGGVTDLGRSLKQISEDLADVPLAGVVLITDGADNRSDDLDGLVAEYRARGIPIYAVGVGSERFSRDAEILRVTAPATVLKDTVVEAEVMVRSAGYSGRRTKLTVTDQGRLLQSREIALGSDGEVKTYKVNLSGESEGPRVFQFHMEPLQGEIVEQNNEYAVLVQVEDAQPKILYMEGEPRWEYGFLRRAVEADGNLHLSTLLRQADGKFLRQGIETPGTLQEGFPVQRRDLFDYKAVILGSVEASFFTFDQLRMISDFVSRRGGGFLMLGGRNSYAQGGYGNTPLEDVLPLHLGRGAAAAGGFRNSEYSIRLTGYGAQHPICRLSLSEDRNLERWRGAPNLVGYNPTGGPKPGATVLARAGVPGDENPDPVILAFQRFGRGKAVAFTTASSWRWRMQQDHADNFHELFWRQMLRWLVSDVPDPVAVRTERHSYSPDDVAVLEADVHDESFLPLNDVRLSGSVKAPSGQVTPVSLAREFGSEGRYSGAFRPQEDGIHEVVCEAFRGDKSLGSASTLFRVAESTEEFHQAALNSGLLRRLSSETGGRYYSIGDLDTLAEDISYVKKGAFRVEEKDLWDMPFLFLLLVGLVSAEWILRKRKGLA